MKIVNYEEFVRMPPGTIFAPWVPSVTKDDFEIKVDHGHEHIDLLGKKVWSYNGTMVVMPQPMQHDGFCLGKVDSEFWYYDGDSCDARCHADECDMFLVYEKEDIEHLITILEWAKNGCPDPMPEIEFYCKEEK